MDPDLLIYADVRNQGKVEFLSPITLRTDKGMEGMLKQASKAVKHFSNTCLFWISPSMKPIRDE
jgi:hypothetical protein